MGCFGYICIGCKTAVRCDELAVLNTYATEKYLVKQRDIMIPMVALKKTTILEVTT